MADTQTPVGYFHHNQRKLNPKDQASVPIQTPDVFTPTASSAASLRGDSTFDLSEPNIARHWRSSPSSVTSFAPSEDGLKRPAIPIRVESNDDVCTLLPSSPPQCH